MAHLDELSMDTIEKLNYYDRLGVVDASDEQQIKRAYQKVAIRWHPDKVHDTCATARFQLINEAKDVLLDPVKRTYYDTWKRHGSHGDRFDPDETWGGIPWIEGYSITAIIGNLFLLITITMGIVWLVMNSMFSGFPAWLRSVIATHVRAMGFGPSFTVEHLESKLPRTLLIVWAGMLAADYIELHLYIRHTFSVVVYWSTMCIAVGESDPPRAEASRWIDSVISSAMILYWFTICGYALYISAAWSWVLTFSISYTAEKMVKNSEDLDTGCNELRSKPLAFGIYTSSAVLVFYLQYNYWFQAAVTALLLVASVFLMVKRDTSAADGDSGTWLLWDLFWIYYPFWSVTSTQALVLPIYVIFERQLPTRLRQF